MIQGGFSEEANRHERWMDISGRKAFTQQFRQTVHEFIEMQHSQATWSRSAMGKDLALGFDRDLKHLMEPYSSGGILEMEIQSEITWGKPRPAPGI